jgi:DNA-binding transcriptional LysR family regulator
LEELDVHFGPVVEFQSHRLKITDAGRAVKRHFAGLKALANGREIPLEQLTIEAEPWLCETLLPRVLHRFLALWGSVQVRIRALTDSATRNIHEGTTSMAIAVASDEEAPSAKELGRLPWVLASAPGVPGDSGDGADTAHGAPPGTKVFVPSSVISHPSISAFIAESPQIGIIACDAALAMARARAGIALVPDVLGLESGFTKLQARGTAAVQLRAILPRAATVSEPVQAFLNLLRQELAPKPLVEPAAVETSPAKEGDMNGAVATALHEMPAEQEVLS